MFGRYGLSVGCLTGALLCSGVSVAVEPAPTDGAARSRPRIGLVLSGGGARGLAHVGVLRKLEELRIPVDYIAGTSIGSIVGGFYATGVDVQTIDDVLSEVDWNDVLDDRTTFRELSFRRKDDGRRYLTNLHAGLKKWRVVLPRGLLSGQKLNFLIRTHSLPVSGTGKFTDFPIPFKAVAADIVTGEAVVLDHGDVVQAIRASMAIPGIFTPVTIDGRLLVDGGIANNLPVDVVREMGAEIVIAVDISVPLSDEAGLNSMLAITGQTMDLLTRRNMEPQLADADIVLTPELDEYGAMSYKQVRQIVDRGAEVVDRERARLEHLSIGAKEYQELLISRRRLDWVPEPLAFVRIEGNERVDERVIRRRIRSRAGEPLDLEVVQEDLSRIYGLDDFQQTSFDIVEDDSGAHGLVIELEEKHWGPVYSRFGMQLSTDFQGNEVFSATANVTWTRINALGAEWRNDLEIGTERGVFSEYYQPLGFSGTTFVSGYVDANRRLEDFYSGDDTVAEYEFRTLGVGSDFGLQFGRNGELRAGLLTGLVDSGVQTGAGKVRDERNDLGALRVQLVIDAVDNPSIPRSGWLLRSRYFESRTGLGADRAYEKLEASIAGFFGPGRHTVGWGMAGGTSLGSDLPRDDEFLLGGPFRLGAFGTGQLRGQYFGLARLGYYFQVAELPAGVGSGIFVGGLVEAGNAWQESSAVGFDDSILGGAVFVGANTTFGPLFLLYGRAEGGQRRFHVTVGQSF